MTYDEAKVYIEEISKSGSILGLESIQNLMHELGDVQEQLQVIHIAGTNGKGSTGAFIESVLIEAGYLVGRYTSPAVFEALEVWRINQKNITEEEYVNCLLEVKAACERMIAKGMPQPTVFEVETALAFLYFYQKKCDYVLLEVGMGGETDATNLITKPVCSVLTSISKDHMKFLGNTLEEIAKVKAGIIKEGCPVVTSDTQKKEVLEVIESAIKEKQAKMILAKENWIQKIQIENGKICYEHENAEKIELSMSAVYQIENSNLAITVCMEILKLSEEVIQKGIKKTVWAGRFEQILEEPLVIIDGAHNEDAAQKLKREIQNHFTNRKITYIIGVLADKEYTKILEIMLPSAQRVYTVTPSNPRALDGNVLAESIRSFGKEAIYCDSIQKAVKLAVDGAAKDEVIVAFGSLSYLAELKSEICSRRNVTAE